MLQLWLALWQSGGPAWVAKPVKYWTGSAWVQKPVKHWNGSAWVLSGPGATGLIKVWLDPAAVYSGKEVVFLIAGQSNAIGRFGPIDGVLDATDADILMYNATTDALVTAADPLDHFGETADTVGPGLTFAKEFKADYSPSKVILVGGGLGGSGFINGDWMETVNGNHYAQVADRWQAAWARTMAIYPDAIVGGIIWLQGEDEVIDWSSEFTAGRQHNCMPMNLFRIARATLSGFTDTTPVVVCGLPAGTALTANATAYAAVQAGLADIPNLLNKAGYADYTALGVADDRHYTAAAMRTMGQRAATAFTSALASTVTPSPEPTFTPDAANVSTYLSIDVSTTPDFKPIRPNAGTQRVMENKRVWVESGAMQFDGNSELRVGPRVTRPLLTNRDFSFKLRWRASVISGDDGLFGLWDPSVGRRSYVLRLNASNLQFFGSNDGTTATIMLEVATTANTWFETEVRRVGTALSLINGGTTVDTFALAPGYTFFTPTDVTQKFLIGDYANTRNLFGQISRFSMEYLS